VQIANLPLDTNILFMTLMATKMPFVGRGWAFGCCRSRRHDWQQLGALDPLSGLRREQV